MKQKLSLIGILCLGLFLRIYFYVGPGYTDDLDYIYTAYHSLTSHGISLSFLNSTDLNAQRIMSIIPLAVCFKLFGFKESSASIYDLFCSLGCIFLTYLIAQKSLGEKTALLAALLYAVFPLDLFYSTQTGGDIPVAFFLLLGVYLLMTENFFSAGAAWGFSVATKENGLLFPLVLLAYLLTHKETWGALKRIIPGFLLIAGTELFIFYIYTGNPFHYLQIYENTQTMMQGTTSLSYLPKYLLSSFDPNFLSQQGLMGIFPFFVLLYFLIAYRKGKLTQNRALLFFFLWILLTAGYLEFGVMTITFRPILKWIRYWTILICPLTILTANGIQYIKKPVSTVLAILFILNSLWIVQGNIYWIRQELRYDKEPYKVLKTLPRKKIYMNEEFLGRLQLYSKGKWKILPFYPNLPLSNLANSYVLILPSILKTDRAENLPHYLYHVPKKWKFLGTLTPPGENLRPMNQVFKLYYVPPNKTTPSISAKKEASHL